MSIDGDAQDAALIASVRELATVSEANLGIDPELSLLLALEAVDQPGPRRRSPRASTMGAARSPSLMASPMSHLKF